MRVSKIGSRSRSSRGNRVPLLHRTVSIYPNNSTRPVRKHGGQEVLHDDSVSDFFPLRKLSDHRQQLRYTDRLQVSRSVFGTRPFAVNNYWRRLRVTHRCYRLKNELQSGIDPMDENPLTGQSYGFEMISRMPINSMESGEKFLIVGGVGLIIGVDWDTIIDAGFGENTKIEPLTISWNINVPSPK